MADNPENHPKKKPRFECHGGPDVIVVVGGKEFEEYSHSLRCWSGYFDAAFRSGMKESETKRFEFPDKDPKEWELIRSLFCPFPEATVNESNYSILYPWFQELCSNPGMHECDSVVTKMFEKFLAPPKLKGWKRTQEEKREFPNILSAVENCITWLSDDGKKKAVDCMSKILRQRNNSNMGRLVPRILQLLIQHETLREALWTPLKEYLPDNTEEQFNEGKMKELLENPILNEFIDLKASC